MAIITATTRPPRHLHFTLTLVHVLYTYLLTCTKLTITSAFSVFPTQESKRFSVPSKTENVNIELPDFDLLFSQIREVSPLACMAFDGQEGGFAVAEEKYKSPLNWKKVEAKKNAVVHRIDKCEYYNNEKNPVVRFRCSLEGPCIGMKMVDYIMKIEERSKWDPQIEALADIYVANDLEEVDRYMNGSEDADGNHVDFSSSVNDSIDTDTCIDTCSEKGERKYGHCGMFGIGYTKTKRYLVVDGREQLTLCGLQEFPNGSALIWGVEMEERHNDLFPPGERRTRAKTRLYTTAIVPTSSNTFDAEYCLQLDPGGALPSFLTTPIMIDSVKTMFTVAKGDFGNEVLMKDWMSEHLLKNDDGSNAYGDEDGDDSDSVSDEREEMIKESVGLIMTP